MTNDNQKKNGELREVRVGFGFGAVCLQMFSTVYENGHTDIDWCESRLREVKEKMRMEFSEIQKNR